MDTMKRLTVVASVLIVLAAAAVVMAQAEKDNAARHLEDEYPQVDIHGGHWFQERHEQDRGSCGRRQTHAGHGVRPTKGTNPIGQTVNNVSVYDRQ